MPLSVPAPLVLSHHSDRPKTNLGVRLYCPAVRDRGVDGEATVAALGDQPVDDEPQRFGSESVPLNGRREHDVERRDHVLGIALLVESEPAGDLPLDLDRECVAVLEQIVLIADRSPPLTGCDDLGEGVKVRVLYRPQRQAL